MAVLVLLFVSCATRGAVREEKLFVYLTNNARYMLLPAADIEQSIDMAQQISASYGSQGFFFNAWVKADERSVEMTLFNEMGATVGELSYADGLAHFSSEMFPKSMKPEYIIADFKLCFYDPLALRTALESCGLQFNTDETSGSAVIRRILDGKNTIIEIEKTSTHVTLKNYLRGYNYTLEGEFK
jgi:hypothetical protein